MGPPMTHSHTFARSESPQLGNTHSHATHVAKADPTRESSGKNQEAAKQQTQAR